MNCECSFFLFLASEKTFSSSCCRNRSKSVDVTMKIPRIIHIIKIKNYVYWKCQTIENVDVSCTLVVQSKKVLSYIRKFVRNSIAQVVATVAKHDLPKNQWPQLFLFIQQYTRSQSSAEREVGYIAVCMSRFYWCWCESHWVNLSKF